MFEDSGQILAVDVDCRLTADRSVEGAEERRRHQGYRQPSQIGSCYETCEVGERSSAHGHDEVAARDAEPVEPAIATFSDLHRLGRFTIGQDAKVNNGACVTEAAGDGIRNRRGWFLGKDGHPTVPCLPDEAGDVALDPSTN